MNKNRILISTCNAVVCLFAVPSRENLKASWSIGRIEVFGMRDSQELDMVNIKNALFNIHCLNAVM